MKKVAGYYRNASDPPNSNHSCRSPKSLIRNWTKRRVHRQPSERAVFLCLKQPTSPLLTCLSGGDQTTSYKWENYRDESDGKEAAINAGNVRNKVQTWRPLIKQSNWQI